jgi:hypothetical protein
VVLYRNRVKQTAVQLYMGTERQHTVFKAKLACAEMGANLLNMKIGKKYVIATDNQATIQMICNEKAILGEYLINALHRQIKGVTKQQPGAKIVVRWVP